MDDRREIIKQMDMLDALIGTWHKQINDIAAREAAAAIASYPQPYSDPQLAAAKERLVESSRKAVHAMQALHNQLVN